MLHALPKETGMEQENDKSNEGGREETRGEGRRGKGRRRENGRGGKGRGAGPKQGGNKITTMGLMRNKGSHKTPELCASL